MIKRYILVTAMTFSMTLLANGPFGDLARSFESVEQDRTICLQDCRDKFGYLPFFGRGGVGGGNDGNWRLYFKCIDDCEKKFWKEWQKREDEMNEK